MAQPNQINTTPDKTLDKFDRFPFLKDSKKLLAFIGLTTLIFGAFFLGGAFNKFYKGGADMEGVADRDFSKIDKSKIVQGCLGGKDCIPSIDNPKFESAEEASEWLSPQDTVFGVNHKGVQKAYPQRILNWHEIVNDMIAEDPIAVTFCPLCGTAVSFERRVKGQEVEFGVSGKLYNSDLIMYDRLEESYWQQATGEAIVGPAAKRNESLEFVSTITTSWERWREKYPSTLVLSKDTGFTRDYDLYPYGTYEEDEEIYFETQNSDERLHPKEVVYGIIVNNQAKAYREGDLIKDADVEIEDTVGGDEVFIHGMPSGEIQFLNKKTGEEIISLRGFWFSWVAFNPDTEIYSSL